MTPQPRADRPARRLRRVAAATVLAVGGIGVAVPAAAVDPIATTSVLLDPNVVGADHVRVAADLRALIEHYRELRDVITLLGVEELGREERLLVGRARKMSRFLTQPFFVAEAYNGLPGRSVPVAQTVAGAAAILAGECDDWDEGSLYMVGDLAEARVKEQARRGSGAAP